MKTTTNVFTIVLLLGLAGTAAAHGMSPVQSFAARLREMQALSSTDPYVFDDARVLANVKGAATLSATPADPLGKQSFADKFARMQAASSNSGEFELRNMQSGEGQRLRFAAASPVNEAEVDVGHAHE